MVPFHLAICVNFGKAIGNVKSQDGPAGIQDHAGQEILHVGKAGAGLYLAVGAHAGGIVAVEVCGTACCHGDGAVAPVVADRADARCLVTCHVAVCIVGVFGRIQCRRTSHFFEAVACGASGVAVFHLVQCPSARSGVGLLALEACNVADFVIPVPAVVCLMAGLPHSKVGLFGEITTDFHFYHKHSFL
jgi:hypothetical protein